MKAANLSPMAKQPRITVLQPDPVVTLDRFERWLLDAGVRLSVVPLYERDVPQLPSAGDGILVLGGRMSAHDQATHRWIDPLSDLLADAHSIDLPILGICLGHQILAQALGGVVEVPAASGSEEGAVSIDWLPAAADDPVLAELAAQGSSLVTMSHHDVVTTLPAGAIELARSATYPNQAFRLGSAWGVQFHPEMSPGALSRIESIPAGRRTGLVAELTAADEAIQPAARLVATGFARYVREA